MILKELQPSFPLTTKCNYKFISRDGLTHDEPDEILNEHSLTLFINGTKKFEIVCLPEYLPELVLGRLCSEGIISALEDVQEMVISEDGQMAEVILSNGSHKNELGSSDFKTISGTADVKSSVNENVIPSANEDDIPSANKDVIPSANEDDIPSANKDVISPANETTLAPLTSIEWKPEWIFALADKFAAGMPLHEKTWATHSCILSIRDQILFDCEDIGRHNALDKVIGYALLHGYPLTECTVYSSGRVPLDMAMKAIRARIPVYVSKAAPTQKSIETARQYNLTLICAARRDRMKLF